MSMVKLERTVEKDHEQQRLPSYLAADHFGFQIAQIIDL
jgi:hypothetical protein